MNGQKHLHQFIKKHKIKTINYPPITEGKVLIGLEYCKFWDGKCFQWCQVEGNTVQEAEKELANLVCKHRIISFDDRHKTSKVPFVTLD